MQTRLKLSIFFSFEIFKTFLQITPVFLYFISETNHKIFFSYKLRDGK